MKKVLFYVFFGLICTIIGILRFIPFRTSDYSLLNEMNKDSIHYDIKYFQYHSHSIRYLFYQNPDASKPLLVFIHGAPGSSTDLLPYITNDSLRRQYSIILVDRLGYGYSNYGSFSNMDEQSLSIIELIKNVHSENQKVCIIGHSYGATIAGVIACKNPSFLTATVMMAPAIDPNHEKYFWFGKIGLWKGTRWLVSGALRVAADEKYNHALELKEKENLWQHINTPILHIHGTKDSVVPFENIQFSKSRINPRFLTCYEWQDMNHFFPFTQKEKVINIINEFCTKYLV